MSHSHERLSELLVERLDRSLDGGERSELKSLLDENRDWHPADLEIAAAVSMRVFDSAVAASADPMPASIRSEVIERWNRESGLSSPTADQSTSGVADFAAASQARERSSGVPWGWLAAAACLVLALTGWWPQLSGQGAGDSSSQQVVENTTEVDPPAIQTVAQLREAIVSSASKVQWDWTSTGDPLSTELAGDVVFDPETQQGVMTFRGLEINDASVNQYQLWIFDATRDDRYPIDGGVFDIEANESGEVMVAIRAAIDVREPALFAVTLEKPGGVVVSSRERIVSLAQPEAVAS